MPAPEPAYSHARAGAGRPPRALRLARRRSKCEHTFVPRYSEQELREVVATSDSLSQVLRHFGLRPAYQEPAAERRPAGHRLEHALLGDPIPVVRRRDARYGQRIRAGR